MDVQVNFWGVILAAISSMVVGMIWYAPQVLGKQWQHLTSMTDEKMKKGSTRAIILAFIMSLLLAYILAHVSYLSHKFFGGSFLNDSLNTAFWLWLGVALTTIVVHDSFEQRPRRLTVINATNQLITMLVMGLIIGLVGF
jgi:Protein of unknown function (DUF1761)